MFRRKFIPGISDISLYRVGDEVKRDAIKGDGEDGGGGGWNTGAVGDDKETQVQQTILQLGEMEIHPRRSVRETVSI